LDVSLPREEAANIALHFVQYSAQQANNSSYSNISAVEKCADVIEKEMNVKIDKTGFHYFRFVTHVYYLLDRAKKQTSISSDNEKMFLALKEECPATYQCALSVKKTLGVDFNDEEILYLILHINRLCIREDCYLI
ncbi:MAG: PRD domain-containing protein, partial [Tyzzerella sp.]|nr:PRD domain-containing protein [Tyzzerella sp.]